MSLMKKMARIIQRDMKKSSAYLTSHEVDLSNYSDYKEAKCYKKEDQIAWKNAYRALSSIAYINDAWKEVATEIKRCMHFYGESGVNSPGSTYGFYNQHCYELGMNLKKEIESGRRKKDSLNDHDNQLVEGVEKITSFNDDWFRLKNYIDDIDWSTNE